MTKHLVTLDALQALAQMEPMTDRDYDGFAGIEGEGFTAERDDVLYVIDWMADENQAIVEAYHDGDVIGRWEFNSIWEA